MCVYIYIYIYIYIYMKPPGGDDAAVHAGQGGEGGQEGGGALREVHVLGQKSTAQQIRAAH